MERVEVKGTGCAITLRPCSLCGDVRHPASVLVEIGDGSAHLTRARATQLRDALTAFIEEGA